MKKRLSLVAILVALSAISTVGAALEPQPRIVGGVESGTDQWPFMAALMHRSMALQVGGQTYTSDLMENAPAVEMHGDLADCGTAVTTCDAVSGKVCLIARDGVVDFDTKARNCADGGGVGAIIYNHLDGFFTGKVNEGSLEIPVVSVIRADGLQLLNQLGETVSYEYSGIAPEIGFCGGSYIGNGWVVTAAHCVDGVEAQTIIVNVGGHDLEVDHDNVIPVAQIISHPAYDDVTIQNDVALLKLVSEPVGVTPVTLGTEAQLEMATASDLPVTILGRGGQEALTENDSPALAVPVPKLFEAELSLVTNEQCAQALAAYAQNSNPFATAPSLDEVLYPETFCAGRPEGGIGACFGDSGGPLLLEDNGSYFLMGLTSWGIGCAQPGLYDVYTRLPLYKQEIEAIQAQERTGFSLSPGGITNNTTNQPAADPVVPQDPAPSNNGGDVRSGIGALSIWGLVSMLGLLLISRFRRCRA